MSDIEEPHDNATIISTLTTYLDQKFDSIKRELISETEVSNERLAKKLKQADGNFEFKRAGNKKEFDSNHSVGEQLADAHQALQSNNQDNGKALEAVQRGIQLINRRNKLIKIADSSENGWATVNEYETKPLASDSEDDKKLRKAEVTATRKKKKPSSSRKSSDFTINRPFRRFNDFGSNRRALTMRRHGSYGDFSYYNRDLCFACGNPGH